MRVAEGVGGLRRIGVMDNGKVEKADTASEKSLIRDAGVNVVHKTLE